MAEQHQRQNPGLLVRERSILQEGVMYMSAHEPINNAMVKEKKSTVKIWAHRGASEYAPENTMEAFEWAVKLGADGIELDVHKTKDQQIVVIHDEKLDRTSTGKGWVKNYTLDELRQFDYSRGTGFGKEKHYTIPTLREVYEMLKPTSLTINVELKTGIIHYQRIERELLKIAEEYGMSDRIIYSSFNHQSVEKIHLLDPDAKVGFLYADAYTWMPEYAKKAGMNALHPAFYNLFLPRFMEDCAKNDIDVNIWTIDSLEQMFVCMEAGVNAIITNYPDKAREAAIAWENGTLTSKSLNIGRLISENLQGAERLKEKALNSLDSEARQQIFQKLREKYLAVVERE